MNLPHVTEIISQVGKHWLSFDHVPPDRLEAACQRGSAFHQLAAAHAQKLFSLGEIPDNCVGFFHSFREWFDGMAEEVIAIEQTLLDEVLGFTGTPDAILRIKGDSGLTLLDWKSGQTTSKSWRLQISAYRHLAEKNGFFIGRVATLQPHPEGKQAKFTEFTKSLTPDFAVFLACLTAWRFFNAR